MMYPNVGAGLVGWENEANPYAKQVIPDAQKTSMAAFGLPELDEIETPDLKSPDNLDTESREYQDYVDTGKWLQQQAIKARQAGIDVTKPGFDELAQKTSQEWMNRYADWLDKGRQLNQSYQLKKNALTQQQGANVLTQRIGTELMTPSQAQDIAYKADTELSTIRNVPKTLKFRLGYGAKTLNDYNQKYNEVLAELDDYMLSVEQNPNIPQFAKDQLKQEAEVAKSQAFEMMPDEWKYTQEGLARQRMDISREGLNIRRTTSGVLSPEQQQGYKKWYEGLLKGDATAINLPKGSAIEVPVPVTDTWGNTTYKLTKVQVGKQPDAVTAVPSADGSSVRVTMKDGIGNVVYQQDLDETTYEGAPEVVFKSILKSTGSGYTGEKAAPPPKPHEKDPDEKYKR